MLINSSDPTMRVAKRRDAVWDFATIAWDDHN